MNTSERALAVLIGGGRGVHYSRRQIQLSPRRLVVFQRTNAVVLSVDEKTQIQALNRTQPILPVRPSLPARQTHDYERNGPTRLYVKAHAGTDATIIKCNSCGAYVRVNVEHGTIRCGRYKHHLHWH